VCEHLVVEVLGRGPLAEVLVEVRDGQQQRGPARVRAVAVDGEPLADPVERGFQERFVQPVGQVEERLREE
jgi:hypothetical protein